MSVAWRCLRGVASLVVPIFPEHVAFGPVGLQEIALALAITTAICAVVGHWLTRSTLLLHITARLNSELRDEAWEEIKPGSTDREAETCVEEAQTRRGHAGRSQRTSTELLFITVHNGAVVLLAALAWLVGSPKVALYAFCLEISYEVFDAISLGRQRMDPETVVHHIVSPICILCSMQTEVDFRVLCHLCICIDLSGALLGYCKFLLRYSHVSPKQVYRSLTWVYAALRVVGPFIDTVIIVLLEIRTRVGGFGSVAVREDGQLEFGSKMDWTRLYFWAIAVLNSFNLYFFCVIRERGRMPAQLCATLERTGCS